MKNNQSGQSTIEFIFSFVFAVSLILLVFNTSLNYAAGYVTHYATFMASRVFLTQDSNDTVEGPGDRSVAETAARETFEKYKLEVFGIDNSAFAVNDPGDVGAGEYLMIGAHTTFERKMDVVGRVTGQQKLQLISESYLGREPTRGVCAQRTCFAITGQNGGCHNNGANLDITLFDDGC